MKRHVFVMGAGWPEPVVLTICSDFSTIESLVINTGNIFGMQGSDIHDHTEH